MEPYPRLCCLRISKSFEGFGFSLVATKNEVGQFIEDVKPNSPSELAGLKQNDFVVEVNGQNIFTYSHKQVVALIRKNAQEISLLVLDPESRKYYDKAGIIVNSQMDEVKRICSWETSTNNSFKEMPKLGVLEVPDFQNSHEPPKNLTDLYTSVENGDLSSPIQANQVKPPQTVIQPVAPRCGMLTNRKSRFPDAKVSFGARAKEFNDL